MLADAQFLFMICQTGAEAALKVEMARRWPVCRFAFSRPGFVTFKLPDALKLNVDFESGCTLARTGGFSLGKVQSANGGENARRALELAKGSTWDHIHVYERDAAVPGFRGFEPGVTPLAEEVGNLLREEFTRSGIQAPPVNQIARPGQRVLDCVMVEPNEWWVGWHLATTVASQWPGGVPQFDRPEEMVSRAYLKMREALAWSRLPIRQGDAGVEVGSAPGGAAQALLEAGLHVVGIDPAVMDEVVAEHPNFTHTRKRVADVRRREFRDTKWLFVDSNIAPRQSLADIEAVAKHREIKIRGLIMTLKLTDWKTAERIPEWEELVRSWGFAHVATRQLAFNRREICLAALRTRPRNSNPT